MNTTETEQPAFTAGPWRAITLVTGTTLIETRGELDVAKIYHKNMMTGEVLPGHANAALIAAAPDLLAACQSLVALEAEVDDISDDESTLRMMSVIANARFAITKATGGPA